MSRKSKRKKSKPRRTPPPPHFPVGTKVRVKDGTPDADYEDLSLGGWTGTIIDVDKGPSYLIEWDERTLAAMSAVYRKRCERDGYEPAITWLDETDLEADSGQPTPDRVPRPLNMNDRVDRVRSILGLSADQPLPELNANNLGKYRVYLDRKLSFPFEAKVKKASGFQLPGCFSVIDLSDDFDSADGLRCECDLLDEMIELPLSAVQPRRSDPNRQLLDDYSWWYWNCGGEEDEEGEDSESSADDLVASAFLTSPLIRPLMILFFVGVGASCGAVIGAAWVSLENAALAIRTGAVVLASLGLLKWIVHGRSLQSTSGIRHFKWVYLAVLLILGGLAGGMLGAALVAWRGAILGVLAGIVLGQVAKFLRWDSWSVPGAILGFMIGIVVESWQASPEDVWWGGGLGALVGGAIGLLCVYAPSWILTFPANRRRFD